MHRVRLHAALSAVPGPFSSAFAMEDRARVALPQVLETDGDVFELPGANHVRTFAMGTVRLMVLTHLRVPNCPRVSIGTEAYTSQPGDVPLTSYET